MPTNLICLRINPAVCFCEHSNKRLVLGNLDPFYKLKYYTFKCKYFHGLNSYDETLASRGTKYSIVRSPEFNMMKTNKTDHWLCFSPIANLYEVCVCS